ncbi:ComEC/Rec2 family competence protein [Burkholderia stagnalis]|uniref:ComEC/Rec2 family competence protein n=1 Tax=Burkholderia stagnalis TaxID=1503054 RepID=UPI0009BD00D4|nr:MBL fold metallo-hydrolase [Burkholderia stagnalis]
MTKSSIVIVDVGHGNCSVMRDEENVAIFDCARKTSLLEYLESEKITEIDTIIISHADEDHLSGLIGILGTQKYKIKQILLNPDAIKETRIWDDVKYALNTEFNLNNISIETGVKAGIIKNWAGGRTRIEVISPSLQLQLTGSGGKLKDKRITTNTMSIVVRILYDENPVITLAGDMDQIALSDILENKRNMEAKFLVYPHHGGNSGNADLSSFTNSVIKATKPETVIFSNGREKFNNPQPAVVHAIKSFGLKTIACTQLSKNCSQNTVDFVNGNRSKKFSSGARHGFCCAGSIEIDLASQAMTAPTESHHIEFVKKLDRALCR